MKLSIIILSSFIAAAGAVSDLKVTLRGKKYTVSDVESVKDLENKMHELSGEKGRLLFGGKRLNSDEILQDAGVLDGSALNMVPGGKTKAATTSASKSSSSSSNTVAKKEISQTGMDVPDMSALKDIFGGGTGGMPNMEDIMKNMPQGMEMPNMDESMDMMANMMNSPLFQEYMSDPEKLEQSRQMILNNPMMKSMMSGMPGMEELLASPEAWREAMTAAANLYQQLDPEDLKNALKGNMPPGMFGGEGGDTNSALDELSEGED